MTLQDAKKPHWMICHDEYGDPFGELCYCELDGDHEEDEGS